MYFNYHAMAQQLIKAGNLVEYKIIEKWNNITPALVLFFNNHKPMPIRQEKWKMYFELISKENKLPN